MRRFPTPVFFRRVHFREFQRPLSGLMGLYVSSPTPMPGQGVGVAPPNGHERNFAAMYKFERWRLRQLIFSRRDRPDYLHGQRINDGRLIEQRRKLALRMNGGDFIAPPPEPIG